ncbi:hypothetical protein ERJ75_000969500 [Trypanosoma vivax]|uniref:PDZ domain-containing protein n=1 Tax=Trypanosoma vivax (strain Y486) TaxID=1055687 RepID=G0U6D2_TRYVY|nr:hypothetical protein TRVL_01343 [Trypanosoma vivax]KAH8611453.1 hypothetical protein ERJ75_000969500 [Trypanosoma vivax]CCC51436.1 conserved hypothetical protein [Trypanosoma vivax Y486]
MIEALNNRFDILLSSNVCTPNLIDVLRLLVAHANETELFKQELRSVPVRDVVQQHTLGNPNYDQVYVDLQAAVTDAKESVLLMLENSLRSYTANLKSVNDIALATSSKELRQLKSRVHSEMVAFEERVVNSIREEVRSQLDTLRLKWLESICDEVGQLKSELLQVGFGLQREMRRITDECARCGARVAEILKTDRLEAPLRFMEECAHGLERLRIVEEQIIHRVEVSALCERIDNIERRISQLASCEPHVSSGAAISASWLTKQLTLQPSDDSMPGLIVTSLEPNSQLALAGVTRGCIVTHAGHIPVSSLGDLKAAMFQAGEVVPLTIYNPVNLTSRVIKLVVSEGSVSI